MTFAEPDLTPEQAAIDTKARRIASRRRNLRQPDADWITPSDAAARMCISPQTLFKHSGHGIRTVSRSVLGSSGRAVGLLWSRDDVDAVGRIRRECRLSINQALRVFVAMKKGRL